MPVARMNVYYTQTSRRPLLPPFPYTVCKGAKFAYCVVDNPCDTHSSI